jgi:hypothetical protein
MQAIPRLKKTLVQALNNGHVEVIEWMRSVGIQMDFASNQEELFDAVSRGKIDTVQILLDAGMDPSEADYDGRTALHVAYACKHEAIARLLISSGASL